EDIRLIQAAQRATAAYWNESPTVGIYELKQYLGTLRQAEKLPDNPRIRRDRTYLSMTLTHGRLAKLYGKIGQTNLSAEQIAEAINCSGKTAHLVITNEVGLSNHVALWDRVIMLSNPQGGANERQPFSSQTNQTSAAAASRRSP